MTNKKDEQIELLKKINTTVLDIVERIEVIEEILGIDEEGECWLSQDLAEDFEDLKDDFNEHTHIDGKIYRRICG